MTTNNGEMTIGGLLKQVGDLFESNQNKFNRSIFNALPPTQQIDTLQNCRDTGIRVPDISKMTGIPESTIYSKTKTKK